MGGTIIHLCVPKLYKFQGIKFEFGHAGPWPLKKDGEPKKRAGRKFYRGIRPGLDMAPEFREAYRVGGGCEVIHA
jgi:hypothetical protein